MSAEENKAIVVRYFEATHNHRDLSVADELMSPEQASRIKGFFPMLVEAFPNARFTIHDVFAEGDRVALRATVTGTHLGTWHDWNGLGAIEATGKVVTVHELFIYRLENGKIVDEWSEQSLLAAYAELGVFAGRS